VWLRLCRPRSWRARRRKGAHCILGNPVANRNDPLRIAEEMAMIDCICRGRLDVGYVPAYRMRSSPPTPIRR
jgi:hypothetical protein